MMQYLRWRLTDQCKFRSPSKAAIATPSSQLANEKLIELIMPVRVG
ncbi:MAG: hypothetical protein IPH77_00005 [Ignavibacteria bacterium]|nr:hypothetical protein [Ignavibacteria bacterium]